MTMRITYNSVNVDLPAAERFEPMHMHESSSARTATGIIQTVNKYGIYEIEIRTFFQDTHERQLQAWWAWARQGKTFSVAKDSTKVGSTTLDAAAASGQKNVPLTATAAFAADDECLIKAVDTDDEFEIVIVDSVDAGIKIVAESNLVNSYTSGDQFRHRYYFPSVKRAENMNKFDPKKNGSWWEFTFRFVEALS